jgi:hypothetical protein
MHQSRNLGEHINMIGYEMGSSLARVTARPRLLKWRTSNMNEKMTWHMYKHSLK